MYSEAGLAKLTRIWTLIVSMAAWGVMGLETEDAFGGWCVDGKHGGLEIARDARRDANVCSRRGGSE